MIWTTLACNFYSNSSPSVDLRHVITEPDIRYDHRLTVPCLEKSFCKKVCSIALPHRMREVDHGRPGREVPLGIVDLLGGALHLYITPSVKNFTSVLYGLSQTAHLVRPVEKARGRVLADTRPTDKPYDHLLNFRFYCLFTDRGPDLPGRTARGHPRPSGPTWCCLTWRHPASRHCSRGPT